MAIDWDRNDPEDTNDTEAAQASYRKWKITLAVVCVIVLLYGLFVGTASEHLNLGSLEVTLLLHGAAAWAVFAVLTNEWRTKSAVEGGRRISFMLVLGVMAVAGAIGYISSGGENGRLDNALVAVRGKMIDDAKAKYRDPSTAASDSLLDTAPFPKDQIEKVKQATHEVFNQAATMRREYYAERATIGWENLLNPERLKHDRSLVEGRKIVRNGAALIQKYKERTKRIVDSARQQIQALDVDNELKQGILYGLTSERIGDRIWNIRAEEAEEVGKIVEMLATSRDKWEISGDRVLYKDPDLFKQYNAHLATLNDILHRRVVMQEEN